MLNFSSTDMIEVGTASLHEASMEIIIIVHSKSCHLMLYSSVFSFSPAMVFWAFPIAFPWLQVKFLEQLTRESCACAVQDRKKLLGYQRLCNIPLLLLNVHRSWQFWLCSLKLICTFYWHWYTGKWKFLITLRGKMPTVLSASFLQYILRFGFWKTSSCYSSN